MNAIDTQTVLVTGAGGSIGSALVVRLAAFRPRHVVLLDHSERGLDQIDRDISRILPSSSYSSILGDISDEQLLRSIFRDFGPRWIFHAAAFKHVPLMERNPLAALRNNAIGTYHFARLAREQGAEIFLMVSTDKAVEPMSVMGASKRVAEIALATLNGPRSRMTAIRLGNVLGSHGSVVPLFSEQIRRGGPVTVPHPDVSRYFLSISDAVELIIASAKEESGGILAPRVGRSVKILSLAHQMISRAGAEAGNEIEIVFTGLRPGDKLSEKFLSATESVRPGRDPRLFEVVSMHPSPEIFDVMMATLSAAVERNDIPAALGAVQQIVLDYRPSVLLAPMCRSAKV
jgi:FlaA1/EpsC-like NDP-sugar epimerase